MADCSKYILLSKSAQVSCGFMISWSPFRTANPYTMCVHRAASMSLGRYLPTPCLQEQIRYSKSSFDAGSTLLKSQCRAKQHSMGLRLQRQLCWRFRSSRTWGCVSGLQVQKRTFLDCSMPNDEGTMNFQITRTHTPCDTVSHPRRHESWTHNEVFICIGIT
jgi:hypothetical protein